jgi:hypothetical protein
MLRGAGWIPVDEISEFAYSIDPKRAGSLDYRLRNEDILLEKAQQKPLFGWGGWGRGRVYSERGVDVSVTDGLWIIIIGTNGWLGYLSSFGLWCLPALMLWRQRRKLGSSLPLPVSLAMLLTITLVDLIPNSGIPVLSWFLAGALLGWLEVQQTTQTSPNPGMNRMRYSSA